MSAWDPASYPSDVPDNAAALEASADAASRGRGRVTVVEDDEYLTELFGPKCPDCGWRRGEHSPGGKWLTRCPRYVTTNTTEESK